MGKLNQKLYEVNKHVRCLKCGNKGAIKFYGNYFPSGLKDQTD